MGFSPFEYTGLSVWMYRFHLPVLRYSDRRSWEHERGFFELLGETERKSSFKLGKAIRGLVLIPWSVWFAADLPEIRLHSHKAAPNESYMGVEINGGLSGVTHGCCPQW